MKALRYLWDQTAPYSLARAFMFFALLVGAWFIYLLTGEPIVPRCPDCTQASVRDPEDRHSFHCIAGLGPTCPICYACECGRWDCMSRCHCSERPVT